MVTLELPPLVEQKLRAKAEAEGLTLEAYLVRTAEREVVADPPPARTPLYGSLAHLRSNISFEEFQELRRETWANFPREFPDPERQ
jgi:hypothetical protein